LGSQGKARLGWGLGVPGYLKGGSNALSERDERFMSRTAATTRVLLEKNKLLSPLVLDDVERP
jgi:hypothetical protein